MYYFKVSAAVSQPHNASSSTADAKYTAGNAKGVIMGEISGGTQNAYREG